MESKSLFSFKEHEYLHIFDNMEEEVHIYETVRDYKNEIVDLVFRYFNTASIINSMALKEKIIGKKASDLKGFEEILENDLKIANQIFAKKQDSKFEIYLPQLDKYYLITSFSINGLFVTIRKDITRQKETEDKIKIQLSVLSEVKEAVIATDENDYITYWNKGAESLFGYTEHEVNDKNIHSALNYRWMSPEDRKKAFHQLKTIEKWYGENLATKKEGRDVYIESTINAYKDNNGKYMGSIYIVNDVTGPTNVKKALEGNYRRLKEAQRIGKMGNWEWDIKSNIVTISDGLYSLYGIDPGKFVKYDTIMDRVVPEDQKVVNNSLEKALREHKPFNYDITICLKDGGYREISCNGEVITDFAGHPLKIHCVEQDITERKEIEHELWEAKNELEDIVARRTGELNQTNVLLQNELEEKEIAEKKLKKSRTELKNLVEELKRSNEELQQFAYVTSHDLQEPLRTISSFTQLLENRYKGQMDSNADEFIEYIVDATNRMQNLIKDLLEYSRVTTRGNEFELVDSEEIIEKTISNLRAAITESNAQISYGELPQITADSRQIGQLFQNLISNAIKFKKPEIPPKINIQANEDKENGKYIFSVHDNGIGIEEEYFDRIFTIFQRLHTRDEYSGTGMGLSISKKIVERHGGNIWVESEFQKGSIFYFTINLPDDDKLSKMVPK